MTYEVVTTEFRTELHARWSVFFDHLRVPWAAPSGCDATGAVIRRTLWIAPHSGQDAPYGRLTDGDRAVTPGQAWEGVRGWSVPVRTRCGGNSR